MEPIDRELARLDDPISPTRGPARILIVGVDGWCRKALGKALDERSYRCTWSERVADARTLVARTRFDVILLRVPLAEGSGLDLLPLVHKTTPTTKTIVLAERPEMQTIVEAMRCGAIDFFDLDRRDVNDMVKRVDAAIMRSRTEQEREEKIVKLQKICKELNVARQEVTQQVDMLCSDLAAAYQDIADQMDEVAMGTEFRTLIRQELEVEDLLRTTLEFMLSKTGPTNAAVFLADQDQNFGLGAYVNYDCPRETVSVLLDHLCDAICPQMVGEHDVVAFDDAREFSEWVGVDGSILGDSQVIAFACHHEGECLAVIVLFRSERDPFDGRLGQVIDVLRPNFAEQIANIIRIHHRGMAEWPDEPVDEGDEYNDDYGFGYGGLAA